MMRLNLVMAASLAAALCVAGGHPAHAGDSGDPGNPGDSGGSTNSPEYRAWATMKTTGNAAPKGKSSVRVRIPPTCWWTAAPGPNQDPVAMKEYYDNNGLSNDLIAAYGGLPWAELRNDIGTLVGVQQDVFNKQVEEAKNGKWDKTWYVGICRSDATRVDYYSAFDKYLMGSDAAGAPRISGGLAIAAFANGDVPAPLVTPKDLAEAARSVMYILEPAIYRNPMIKTADDATIVGFDTWLWVKEDAAIGGDDGTRTIRAEIGAVYAEVTARTDGMTATSPAGSADCTTKQARTAWSKTAKNGCVIDFSKASVAYPKGYPVQTTVTWTADWIGSGNTSGDLDPLTRTATTDIPVAEVQTIVTG